MKYTYELCHHLDLKTRNSEFSIRIYTILLFLLQLQGIGFAQQTPLKIGLLADVQYCDCPPAGAREYALSLEKLGKAIPVLQEEKVDYTVLLGDLIDHDLKSYTAVWNKLEPLKSNLVFVPGNHDFSLGEGEEADRAKTALRSCFPEVRIAGNVRLLFLNALKNSIVAWPEGSAEHAFGLKTYNQLKAQGAPNAQDWNGGLGIHQLRWIRSQVALANRKGQSLVLFCHLPALPGDAHSLWDTPELLEILQTAEKPVLYICGHKHSGGDDTAGNVRIVTLKGMVEQKAVTFGILAIFDDRWEIMGFGEQGSFEGRWD